MSVHRPQRLSYVYYTKLHETTTIPIGDLVLIFTLHTVGLHCLQWLILRLRLRLPPPALLIIFRSYVSHSGQVVVAITAAVVAAAAVAGATAAATAATLIHAGCCGCAVADASNCWLLLLLLLP